MLQWHDMEFFEVVQSRQSIRKFQAKPIAEDRLNRILEATNRAPSAGNLQAYRVFVVKHPSLKAKLDAASGNQGCIAQAPVILVFCTDPARSAARYGSRGEELYSVQDATIACAYAQLAVTALGLASVWIGAVFEPETVREALRLEEGMWPIALLPIGYPAEHPPRTPRRVLQDLVQEL